MSPSASSFLRYLVAACTLCAAQSRAAFDPPANYYASAPAVAGGETLKSTLHNIIRGHDSISYNAAWSALEILHQDPQNSANLILLYNGESRAKSLRDQGNENQNWWNREHVWPQSSGVGGTGTDAGSDLHHLFPADKNVNGRRGSLPFDNVTGGTVDPEAPLSRYTSSAYMPRDADKGIVARAMLYMVVRYEGTDSGVQDLELQESLSVSGPRMARLSTLLAWHRAFPPTETERKRNHQVDTLYQGNRNPFIDNPLFADRLFNNDAPFAAWRRPHFTSAELNNASIAGDTADPDRDGLPNLLEFAFNLSPRVADAAGANVAPALTLLPPASVGASPRLSLAHRRHRYASDLVIRYETSTDLTTWTVFTPSTTSTTYLDAQTDRVTIETPLNGTRRFVRVRVDRTPP